MSDDKLRAALEAAKEELDPLVVYKGVFTPVGIKHLKETIAAVDEALKSEPPLIGMSDADYREVVQKAKNDGYQEGYEARAKEEALNAPAENPDDGLDAFKQTKQEIADLKQFLESQSGGHVRNQLLNLPDAIKDQQVKVAQTSQEIEKLRLLIAHSRNQAFEFISGIKEGDKLKYSNEKARTVAQESYLAEDKEYLENCDKLGRQEWRLKVEQIELDFLHDSFKATLAIAQMQGVR